MVYRGRQPILWREGWYPQDFSDEGIGHSAGGANPETGLFFDPPGSPPYETGFRRLIVTSIVQPAPRKTLRLP
jgi:hypothetical protein